jgi:hypothetical protein
MIAGRFHAFSKIIENKKLGVYYCTKFLLIFLVSLGPDLIPRKVQIAVK